MELLPPDQRSATPLCSSEDRIEFPQPPKAHTKAGRREQSLNSVGGRVRADADAKEFRNQYYRPRDTPFQPRSACAADGAHHPEPSSVAKGGASSQSTTSSGGRKVIAVIGSTGTGKSQLAVEIAQAIASCGESQRRMGTAAGAEVISSDSMQMYRGLDVITNKATSDEMAGVKHHLMGFLQPGQQYTIGQFVKAANTIVSGVQYVYVCTVYPLA